MKRKTISLFLSLCFVICIENISYGANVYVFGLEDPINGREGKKNLVVCPSNAAFLMPGPDNRINVIMCGPGPSNNVYGKPKFYGILNKVENVQSVGGSNTSIKRAHDQLLNKLSGILSKIKADLKTEIMQELQKARRNE